MLRILGSPRSLCTTPAQPVRRRRLWRAPLAAFGLFALIAGAWWYIHGREERDFQAALAETDRLDPGWRLDDIVAACPTIPGDRNAAKQARKVCPMISGTAKLPEQVTAPLFSRPLNVQPPQAAVDALRQYLDPLHAARDEAHKLKDMPDSDYDPDVVSPIWAVDARFLAELVKLDTILRLQEGNPVEIADSLRVQLNVARATHKVPNPWRESDYAMAVFLENLERVLAQHELPANELRALQPLLQREIDEPNLTWWLRAYRAEVTDGMRPLPFGRIVWPRWSFAWWHESLSGSLDRATSLRVWNRLVEASKLPMERQLDEFEGIDKYCDQQPPDVASFKHFCTIAAEHVSNQAMLRCALTAVAVERYRQERRRWPGSLDAVVEARLLKAVPIDPCDGKSLRYRALADGVLIYSAGADRIDNGGTVLRQYQYGGVLNRTNPIAAGADIGFQLWDAGKRGQSAAP
jgi:hypothetical protein